MKAIILSLFLILTTTVSLNAQKLIAVQSGDNATFYTSLDTALLHAKDGDDIYLPGGFIKTSGAVKIDKTVAILGVGYNSLSNSATENTILACSAIKILPTAKGASITGIYAKNCTLQIQDTVSQIIINRCLFNSISIGSGQSILPPSDIRIMETIVENAVYADVNTNMNSNLTGPQNVSILNCIIGTLNTSFPLRSNWVWNGLVCKNSIIMGYNGGYDRPLISYIEYSVFDNCIFIEESGCCQMRGNNCTFRNCMFTGTCAIMQNSVADNCIFGLDATLMFVDPQGFVFNTKNDYRLREESQGKNAGKDGTDIGIYGGAFPWKEGGLPSNPHIASQVIDGSSGNLKVNIKVEAQDH